MSENRKLTISVLGHKSDAIINNFIRYNNSSLELRFIDSYNSLDDYRGSLHVAPLLFGAGVKIKVIEAYESGIPTLGTTMSFQGIENEFIQRMGVCVDSIEDICNFLLSQSQMNINLNEISESNSFCRLRINEIIL